LVPIVEVSHDGSHSKPLRLFECPQCFVTPLSDWLIGLYHGSQFPTYGLNGAMPGPAVLFGADVARWPAWWHDAMVTISGACSQADAIQMSGKPKRQ
jgi:hypothetical protein